MAELEKAIDHAGDAVASVGSGESDTKRLQTVLARINASLGTKAASSPSELAGLVRTGFLCFVLFFCFFCIAQQELKQSFSQVEAIEQAVGQAADSVGSKAAGHSSSKPETNVQTFSMAVAPQLAPVAPVAVEKSKETATVGNPADAAPTAAGAATPAAPNLDADVVKTPTVAAEAPDSAAVPATAAKSIYEGNLSKLGGGMFAKWQPRYFRLLQDRIEWSDSDKKPAKNHALLSEVKAIAQADEVGSFLENLFLIRCKKKNKKKNRKSIIASTSLKSPLPRRPTMSRLLTRRASRCGSHS